MQYIENQLTYSVIKGLCFLSKPFQKRKKKKGAWFPSAVFPLYGSSSKQVVFIRKFIHQNTEINY